MARASPQLPTTAELSDLLLALLATVALSAVAFGLLACSAALLQRSQRRALQPAAPPPIRPGRKVHRRALRLAWLRLNLARRRYEYWLHVVRSVQSKGRRPHYRTLHNFHRRRLDVERAHAALLELTQGHNPNPHPTPHVTRRTPTPHDTRRSPRGRPPAWW